MDPLSAGASVLAFISLGLSAAKTIHTIISGLKDGPQIVEHAVANIQGLLATLEGLAESRVLKEDGNGTLRNQMQLCANDVEAFAGKLKKLTINDDERRRGRFWKKLRTIMNEKDLDQMNGVVSAHTSALNLGLNVLHSATTLAVRDDVRGVARVQESQQTTFTEQRTTLRAVSDGVTRLCDGNATVVETVQSLSTTQQQHDVMLRQIIEQTSTQKTTLGAVSDSITRLCDGKATAVGTVQSLVSTSQQQTDAMLRQILEQIAKLSVQQREPTPPVETLHSSSNGTGHRMELDTKCGSEEAPICSKVMETIARVCALVRDRQGRPAPGEARGIIGSLLETLEFLRSGEFLETAVASGLLHKGRCSACSRKHFGDLQAGLTAVYAGLLSAGQVDINTPVRRQGYGKGMKVRSQWEHLALNIGIGILAVTVRTRSWDAQHDFDSTATMSFLDSQVAAFHEEILTSISLLPRPEHNREAIAFSSRKYNGYSGCFSTIPRLAVTRVLPADSPVFSIMRHGRLADFQKLLGEGRVAIGDQDEYGGSLLHYANRNPDICRFLLENGADVDHFGRLDKSHDLPLYGSVLMIDTNEFECGEQKLQSILTCRKYLLEAGCDPTILNLDAHGKVPDPGYIRSSFFQRLLGHGNSDSIRMVLEKGGCFIDFRERFHNGIGLRPVLFEIFESPSVSQESVALLLDHGASIIERDYRGATCLHVLLSWDEWVWWPPADPAIESWIRIRDVIVFLIQRGADVYAVDKLGFSVSATAYASGSLDDGSVAGDIWDSALARCGFSVDQFRQRFPREAQCGLYYDRSDFEILWAGFEHECPYYDDEFLPYEEDNSEDWSTGSDWATTNAEDDESLPLEESSDEDLDNDSDEMMTDSEDGGTYLNGESDEEDELDASETRE